MKRVLGIYAEVFDEETGQVSVASLAEGLPWPPPLEEVRGGAPSQWIREVGGGKPSGGEVEPESSTEVPPSETSASEAIQEPSAVVDAAPESGDEPLVAPMYMDALTQPEGEPAVSDEALPEIEVVDDPAALTLLWDEGVTEKNRRMHMAPFADGMWAVFENGGEYFVFLKRGRLKATEFESQSSLKEAKALASALSKRWMGETEGDTFLQTLAATNARDFVRWVGLTLRVAGDDYHFRRGRVRRQQTTVLVSYVAGKDEDGGRSRIEVRLTPTDTGKTVALWALQYGADGKIVGSFYEADLQRTELAELRGLRFGPAPGKGLRWGAVSKWEEQAEWGKHVLVLQHGRGLSGLALRKRGGDVFLDCGEADALKGRALNVLLRYLRKRSRKEPREAMETTETTRVEPDKADVPPAEEAPRPVETVEEPEAESPPATPEAETPTPRAAEPKPAPTPNEAPQLRLTKTMKAALRKLAEAPAGEVRAVFEGIHWKTRKGLKSNGLVTEAGELTELGWEVSGGMPTRAAPANRAPEPEVESEPEIDDDELDEAIGAEEARAIEDSMGSAVNELASRMPPLPAE